MRIWYPPIVAQVMAPVSAVGPVVALLDGSIPLDARVPLVSWRDRRRHQRPGALRLPVRSRWSSLRGTCTCSWRSCSCWRSAGGAAGSRWARRSSSLPGSGWCTSRCSGRWRCCGHRSRRRAAMRRSASRSSPEAWRQFGDDQVPRGPADACTRSLPDPVRRAGAGRAGPAVAGGSHASRRSWRAAPGGGVRRDLALPYGLPVAAWHACVAACPPLRSHDPSSLRQPCAARQP